MENRTFAYRPSSTKIKALERLKSKRQDELMKILDNAHTEDGKVVFYFHTLNRKVEQKQVTFEVFLIVYDDIMCLTKEFCRMTNRNFRKHIIINGHVSTTELRSLLDEFREKVYENVIFRKYFTFKIV